MIFAFLSRRLRAVAIGFVLVRLTPVLARVLHSAADRLRSRGKGAALASVLAKSGDGLSWVARRRGRGRDAIG